jgi:enamine deaminase RidA (YjgF/YER057c/UK114 family)
MAFQVLHIRWQKQRLIDIPGAKILAHSPTLNQTRSDLNSDYSDRLLAPHFAHAGTNIHLGFLAGGACRGAGGYNWPGRALEQTQQFFGNKSRPRGIEMAIAPGMLPVHKEALRHDQMEVVLCAGRLDIEQATFAIAVSAQRRYAPTQSRREGRTCPSSKHLRPSGLHHNPAYSHVVVASGARTIYIAGQVSTDEEGRVVGEGDLAAQTTQVMQNLAWH